MDFRRLNDVFSVPRDPRDISHDLGTLDHDFISQKLFRNLGNRRRLNAIVLLLNLRFSYHFGHLTNFAFKLGVELKPDLTVLLLKALELLVLV
jgi:hypothetical protein